MSIQAGVWHFDGKPADKEFLESLASDMTDGARARDQIYLDSSISLLYRARHTMHESHCEFQPHVSPEGFVFTWDGRLDNREDLICQLPGAKATSADIEIVGAAFERWRIDSFRKLIGDWALAVWDPRQMTLILAKDYLGTRKLYYHFTKDHIIWSSDLEPILRLRGTSFTLSDEYIAGYLAMYPPAHLTPYREIQSVPRASYVTIRSGKVISQRYWQFESLRPVRYKADVEYEEHFRNLFRVSVRRRLRSDAPILAELSGGIDSSAIVCMADDIIANGETDVPRLDTLSIYDPTEPNGDERNYFSIVEAKRGRVGHRLNRSKHGYSFEFDHGEFAALPGWSRGKDSLRPVLTEIIKSYGYRVVLSGTGGDELLGGIPDPRPQLADSILLTQPVKFARQLAAWSLAKKRPWIQLLFETSLFLLPRRIRAVFDERAKVAPWLDARFASRFDLAANQLGPKGGCGFWKPSRREYAQTVVAMSRYLAASSLHGLASEERRYPYLDRDLIEFLVAIPSDQLLRPGHRRSLMRRALVGVVPDEILFRRTKGFMVRSILVNLGINWAELDALFQDSASSRHGYVNAEVLLSHLQRAKNGDSSLLIPLLRALYLEAWLRGLDRRELLNHKSASSRPAYAASAPHL